MSFEEMYQQYVHDKNGENVVVREHGFYIYVQSGSELWVQDIFVKPESRKHGVAKDFICELLNIAKEKRCSHLVGRVDINHNDYKQALLFHLGVGANIVRTENGIIITALEVENE